MGRGSAYMSEGRLLRRVVLPSLRGADFASGLTPGSGARTAIASALVLPRAANTPPNFVAGPRTFSAALRGAACRTWWLDVVAIARKRPKASRAKLAPRTAPRRSVATSRTALRRAVAAPWFVAVKKLQRLRARPIAVARSAKKLRPPRREARAAERATDRGRATP